MMRVPYISDTMDAIIDVRQYGDPRIRDWFMMFGSPVPVWILSLLYLWIVFDAGPRFMKKRPAYSLRKFLIVYNLSLVILSIYMCAELVLSAMELGYGWLCAPYNKNSLTNPKEMRMVNVMWVYAVSKIVELMDTFLMILRKKFDQVSVLHVYHHVSILNINWLIPFFLPCAQSWFSPCINCLVHVVMYTYYGLAAIPSLRKYLWWKKYITKFQLLQFFLILGHTSQPILFGCDYPAWAALTTIFYMFTLIALFSNFYYRAYLDKKKVVRRKKTDSYANGQTEANGFNHENVLQNGDYVGNGKPLNSEHITDTRLRH